MDNQQDQRTIRLFPPLGLLFVTPFIMYEMKRRKIALIKHFCWRLFREQTDLMGLKDLLDARVVNTVHLFPGFGAWTTLKLDGYIVRNFRNIFGYVPETFPLITLRHLIYLSSDQLLEIPGIGPKKRDRLVRSLEVFGVPKDLIRFKN